MGKKKKLGESTGFRRNRKKVGISREIEFGETFFFFQLPFQDFLGSTLLLPSSPPPLLPSPARGNGRLLGRRSKRRNCLRVQSSKKASSIWRDGVRRARRSLPCPPATAAAAAPCRGDPEPRPARVSRRERTLTHARTHSHSRPWDSARRRAGALPGFGWFPGRGTTASGTPGRTSGQHFALVPQIRLQRLCPHVRTRETPSLVCREPLHGSGSRQLRP